MYVRTRRDAERSGGDGGCGAGGCRSKTKNPTHFCDKKCSESAGKCDNNERKWCKNHGKMKGTRKTLGKIDYKCKKTVKTHEEDVETAGRRDNGQRKAREACRKKC